MTDGGPDLSLFLVAPPRWPLARYGDIPAGTGTGHPEFPGVAGPS
jgi:hypothetical protein